MVADTVRRAAEAAGVALPLRALWAGLAGAGRRPVRRALEAALRNERVARAVRLGTDVEAAFHDAFGGGPGIVVVAGTGSVVLGAAQDGRRLQVGGWGGVMGDEGSGYHIGVSALRAIAAATDRRGPPTALTAAVLESLGLDRPRQLSAWAESATKADIAALAPLAVRAARSADGPATTVIRRALDALREQLSAAVRELFPRHPATRPPSRWPAASSPQMVPSAPKPSNSSAPPEATCSRARSPPSAAPPAWPSPSLTDYRQDSLPSQAERPPVTPLSARSGLDPGSLSALSPTR